MKNVDQTTQSTQGRSFTEDMRQAFIEWVKKLPFIKTDVPKVPQRDNLEDKSAHQGFAPHPTNGALPGQSPADKDRKL